MNFDFIKQKKRGFHGLKNNSNRLLFKKGFINYWILGSVLLVFRRHFYEAILVKYYVLARNHGNLQSQYCLAGHQQEFM